VLQSKYIAECLDEIKQELKQDNLAVKANAVNKLTYVSIQRCSVLLSGLAAALATNSTEASSD